MNLIQRLLPVLIATLLPGLAMAHTGDHIHYSWSAGLLHPLMGLDHLLALIAAGIWLAQQPVRNRSLLGVGFIGALASGLFIGQYFPGVQFESGIVATLIVMGALIACVVKVPALGSVAILCAVAAIHGFVHGTELPVVATAASGFAVMLMLSSGLLFAITSLVVQRVHILRDGLGARLVGMAIALFGVIVGF
jgi:urease accessory protein